MDHHHHHHRRGSEEDQVLVFHHNNHDHHSYPCAYYVQSPSTLSHANSATAADIRHSTTNISAAAAASVDDCSAFHSPARTETIINNDDASRFALSSHYSSRGSNAGQYFGLHAKKISYDARSHDTSDLLAANNPENRLIIINASHHHEGHGGDEDGEYDYYYGKQRRELGWWKIYCSYSNSDSSVWICLQITWRFLVSLIIALLVFYVASRPPPPKVSIQMERVWEFGLGEGVDHSGVTTKILTCNCSLNLIIDNKSKLFGLHIHPPTMEMSFHRLTFALTQGPKMYADSGTTTFPLSVGTRNKAMYGAGREMEDMLESGHGMPLTIRLSFSSTFRVVLNLIRPKFHHQAECLVVLRRGYDKKNRTQLYNSTCTIP